MGELRKIIRRDAILTELKSKSRTDVLREIAEWASQLDDGVTTQEILAELAQREQEGATAIGRSIAIPHARLKGLKKNILLLARSSSGVDFGAEDRLPVKLFFVLLARDSYLRLLSELARSCQNPDFIEAILASPSAESLFSYLEKNL